MTIPSSYGTRKRGRLLHTFEGHKFVVQSVAFSPHGTHVLSGSRDGSIKLWDAASGQLLRDFEDNSQYKTIDSVTFSTDGTRVLAGVDSTMKMWDAATGELLHTTEVGKVINAVAFSRDGNFMLSAADSVKLWDATTGRLLRTFQGDSFDFFYSVAFSPDGAFVLAGGDSNTMTLWDAVTGQLTHKFEGHSGRIQLSGVFARCPSNHFWLLGHNDQGLECHDWRTSCHLDCGSEWGMVDRDPSQGVFCSLA